MFSRYRSATSGPESTSAHRKPTTPARNDANSVPQTASRVLTPTRGAVALAMTIKGDMVKGAVTMDTDTRCATLAEGWAEDRQGGGGHAHASVTGTSGQNTNLPRSAGASPAMSLDLTLSPPSKLAPSAFSQQGKRHAPHKRELVHLMPFSASSRSISGSSYAASPPSASLEQRGFRPISPLHPTVAGGEAGPVAPVVDSLLIPGMSRSISCSPSPTHSARSLSPTPLPRRRSNTFSGMMRSEFCNSFLSPPRSPLRMPRDSFQPSEGSISDLTDKAAAGEEQGEEADSFCFKPFQRQRSSTCPENRAWRRRRVAASNRPPTPPPPLGPTTSPGPGSRNNSPRGSLGEAGAFSWGCGNGGNGLMPLSPSHMPQVREDQDQGEGPPSERASLGAFPGTVSFPRNQVADGRGATGQVTHGMCQFAMDDDDEEELVLAVDALSVQVKVLGVPATSNSPALGRVSPGSLSALRH